jgi:hypothetical protein
MGIDEADGLLERYRSLLARVDAHSSRLRDARGEQIACQAGCAGCCQAGLTVSPIEAAAISEAPATAGQSGRAAGGKRVLTVLDEGREDCVHLDSAGRCRIYAVRPLVCRSHGLPLIFADGDVMVADVCPLNFEDGLDDLEAADFLNQDTLHTILVALNQAWCAAAGVDPRQRVDLGDDAGGARGAHSSGK